MILMNMTDKFIHITLVVILLAVGSVPVTVTAQQTPFEELTQKIENGAVFHADFTHHYEDSYTGNTSTKSGKIWIGNDEYKIDSPGQRLAVDGEISRVYDRERNRLIISTYVPEEDDFAPSRFLNGVDSAYTVVEQQQRDDHYFIKLNSDDPFAMFQQVEITLNEQGIPQKIFVRDTADNMITTTFSDGTFIQPAADIFRLSYPENAEIIDMRD